MQTAGQAPRWLFLAVILHHSFIFSKMGIKAALPNSGERGMRIRGPRLKVLRLLR